MADRAADEGDQKHKFNQAQKLMKKANVDQSNFTRKLVETINSAKSAEENAQQEIVKLDLAGERLNWILFVEKSSLFGGLLRNINRRTWQTFQSAKRCAHAASGSQEEEGQFSYSVPSTADSHQWYRQLQLQTHSFNPSLSCQVLLFFLPVLAEYWNLFCLWKTQSLVFPLPSNGQASISSSKLTGWRTTIRCSLF